MTMVQGKWNITLQTPMGAKHGVLEIEALGAKLSGSMSDGDLKVPITDGKVEGNRLSWSAKLAKPIKANIKFTATVEDDAISGVARHFLGSATFKGTRAP
jgi:hypothetical protein